MTSAFSSTPNRQRELWRTAASLFMFGWEGHGLTRDAEFLLDHGARGVALFAKNVEDSDQTRELCGTVRQRRGRGVLIGIDQEGGRVARLRTDTYVTPSLRELSRIGGVDFLYDVGQMLGLQLASLGIHLNFAPVLDVDTNPDNPVIGDRSLNRDPKCVSDLGVAMVLGMQDVGVAACGKHFPGHGDTLQDSHHDLPRLTHDLSRLGQLELLPFEAAIRGGVAALMTAHIVFEAIDPDVPATMSPAVIDGLLRRDMGFGGVVISDDLEMKAITDGYRIPDVAVSAMGAGVDLLLCCHHPPLVVEAIDAVVSAVDSGRLSEQRVRAAAGRIDALASRFEQTGRLDHDQQEALDRLERRIKYRVEDANAEPVSIATSLDPTEYMPKLSRCNYHE